MLSIWTIGDIIETMLYLLYDKAYFTIYVRIFEKLDIGDMSLCVYTFH